MLKKSILLIIFIFIFCIYNIGFANFNEEDLGIANSELTTILNNIKSDYKEKKDDYPGKLYKTISGDYRDQLDDAGKVIAKADVDLVSSIESTNSITDGNIKLILTANYDYSVAKKSILNAKKIVDDIKYVNDNVSYGTAGFSGYSSTSEPVETESEESGNTTTDGEGENFTTKAGETEQPVNTNGGKSENTTTDGETDKNGEAEKPTTTTGKAEQPVTTPSDGNMEQSVDTKGSDPKESKPLDPQIDIDSKKTSKALDLANDEYNTANKNLENTSEYIANEKATEIQEEAQSSYEQAEKEYQDTSKQLEKQQSNSEELGIKKEKANSDFKKAEEEYNANKNTETAEALAAAGKANESANAEFNKSVTDRNNLISEVEAKNKAFKDSEDELNLAKMEKGNAMDSMIGTNEYKDVQDKTKELERAQKAQKVARDAKCEQDKNCIDKATFEITVDNISPGMSVSNIKEKGADSTEGILNYALGTIIQILMMMLGSFALLIMTIGAGFIILHHGQDELLSKGKSIFMSGVFALIVALASYYLVSIFRFVLFNLN